MSCGQERGTQAGEGAVEVGNERLDTGLQVLPGFVGAGPERPYLSGTAAAVPADAGGTVDLRHGRRRQGPEAAAGVQDRQQGGGQPVQGPGRDAAGAAEGNHHGPGQADAAEGGGGGRGTGGDQRAGGKPDGAAAGAAVRVHPETGEDGGRGGCVA